MAADDKESDERRQSGSLQRDRGKRRRRHRSASPSSPKQRRKHSRSPCAEEKHRYKNSAEKHEDRKGDELSHRNTEGMLGEDIGREVARRNGVEDDEKAGAGKSSKGDRKVELHSSGDSSEDGYSNSESDRGRKKKSRSKSHNSRKSKSKHHRHVHSESEQDESQTEGPSGESSEASEDEYRRAKRRKRLKQKEKAERERKEERRRKKEKKRKMKEKDRGEGKRKRKKEKVEERGKGPISESWGKYGIIEELDMWTRRPEFRAWLSEVKKVNLETLTTREEKDMFKQYMEDYKKYYNIDKYHHRKVTKQRKEDMKDMLNKQSQRTEFKDEEQRRQELIAERAEMKETELDKMKCTVMETGLGKGMGAQAVLREDMQHHYRLGNTEVCKEEKDHDVGDCLEGYNMHGEGSKDDPLLKPNHKIFLSHSGAQKEFVDHLCKALEDRCHYPFFDRRPESLPKGERFPELIVQAVEQCEMLIVVVSNEYFMSKWPMIELSAFVKAHKLQHGSNLGPKILPLFYGLSVSDLDNKGMQKKWFEEWETLVEADPKKRIVVSDWKNALDVLKSFNGLLYDMELKEVVAYVDKIVSHVCKSISPDIKWDDSHVQGKLSICKVIGEKIESIGVSQKYKVKVVGIYGVGGIGKTTTCKTLCNELSSQFEGRVCHIEFPSVSEALFQKVVRDLTKKSMEVKQLNEGECKDILRKSLFKQRTFLAIDNILDNRQSIEEAKMFLEVGYHMDSLVVVTARSESVLRLLGLAGDELLEMPDLGVVDALKLFLYHAVGGRPFFEDEEKHDIMTCIRRCYFSKGNGRGLHYHPLALKALGLQLGCHGENPSLWVKKLPRLKTFNFFPGENPVFDILRSGFDLLPARDQTLFMDVGCFFRTVNGFGNLKLFEWLCFAHKQDEEQLGLQLEHLHRKGLFQDVDLRSREISMHDLYLEFSQLEAKGSFNDSSNLRERMWVYMEDGDLTELEHKPKGGCWHKLARLNIVQSCLVGCSASEKHNRMVDQARCMEAMKWAYFCNVEVLQLCGLHLDHGALNLEGLVNLRILELKYTSGVVKVGGLEELKHLTYFQWLFDISDCIDDSSAYIEGQLPSSLRRLVIYFLSGDHVTLGSNVLARCSNLSKLDLFGIEVYSLDLSQCWSLESVFLGGIWKLQTLSRFASCPPSNLYSLTVLDCYDLVDIPGIDDLKGLKKLDIDACPKWQVPSLLALTELQDLSIFGNQRLVGLAKDCFPHQLQKLRWVSFPFEVLNLSGFNQLEVLDLAKGAKLTSLAELGDLLVLRCLNLGGCKQLLRLPNLSLSKNLTELRLGGCYALELHEKDIQMLSELPLLQPIPFSGYGVNQKFRMDLARRKVLIHSSPNRVPSSWELWMEDEWEERDLGIPPIKIGRRGTWE